MSKTILLLIGLATVMVVLCAATTTVSSGDHLRAMPHFQYSLEKATEEGRRAEFLNDMEVALNARTESFALTKRDGATISRAERVWLEDWNNYYDASQQFYFVIDTPVDTTPGFPFSTMSSFYTWLNATHGMTEAFVNSETLCPTAAFMWNCGANKYGLCSCARIITTYSYLGRRDVRATQNAIASAA